MLTPRQCRFGQTGITAVEIVVIGELQRGIVLERQPRIIKIKIQEVARNAVIDGDLVRVIVRQQLRFLIAVQFHQNMFRSLLTRIFEKVLIGLRPLGVERVLAGLNHRVGSFIGNLEMGLGLLFAMEFPTRAFIERSARLKA